MALEDSRRREASLLRSTVNVRNRWTNFVLGRMTPPPVDKLAEGANPFKTFTYDRGSAAPSATVSAVLVWCVCVCVAASAQRAPSAPDQPWKAPASLAEKQRSATEQDPRTQIEPGHPYTLPELIDLAEHHNPSTRAAWQSARAAGDRVGIARADLLPSISAVVLTNTSRSGILFNEAFVRQTVGLYEPMLQVSYLLLDFGARSARINQARQQLLSANLSFNRTHLDILFETARRFYQLLNAIGQRDAAQITFDNAETVRKAVEARLAVGLATLPDALEARAAAAQANYSLQAAIGEVDTSRGQLLSLLGASPSAALTVQPLEQIATPDHIDLDLPGSTERALAQRPEIGEYVSDRQAAEAQIRSARSAFLPTLDFRGQGGTVRAYGRQNQLNDTYAGPLEEWNASLSLKWELFEGGRRTSRLAEAHDNEKRAQAQIDETRDEVEQQVYTASIAVRTAFAQRDAARQLAESAKASYEAAVKSYQLGLRNTVDVVTAQRTLAQALSSNVSAQTNLLTQLANFAYRTGDLLQSAAGKTKP
ncbi:MAG: TolC family protein [Janthinobacterium lividum]